MPRAITIAVLLMLANIASADIVISEWMYNGAGTDDYGEYVEFTNTGPDPVDMTGWSYDDSSQAPGTIDLSGFGTVAAGESVILTDETAEEFAAAWGLIGVKIVGGCTANLGRNDQINLYDASNNLIDQLAYGDEDYPGTARTRTVSCNIPATDYAYTTAQTTWALAVEGDSFGSILSARGEIGSPGRLVGYALSDFDKDSDVDLADLQTLTDCMTGPEASYDPLPTACTLSPDALGYIMADSNRDGHVDLEEFYVFQTCYSGEGVQADPACGRTWETIPPTETTITLNGDSISVNGSNVTVDGTTATITASGTYTITGTLTDGQIAVNSSDTGTVTVILSGVNVSNSTTAPFSVLSAELVDVVLADQTSNYFSDPTTYVYPDPEEDEPNAAFFSKDSMSISGTGSLTVYAHYNDGITSKDDLTISGGTINVTAVDDGIRGKDYLVITDGTIDVNAGGDGLKSDEDEDTELGYITIQQGSIDIISGGDGIAAETNVTITNGDINITSGGGASATISDDLSAKGIKGQAAVTIEGGAFDIDAADDAIHSNNTITITGGYIVAATGDDAVHADVALGIDGSGTILTITECYEGLESDVITIGGGDIDITSDEDGITAETTVTITGGDIAVTSGGGAGAYISDDFSAKGIKGLVSVDIDAGTFDLDCADDAVHSNDAITIDGGDFTIATGDDGMHADNTLIVNGGTITVTESYEGLEACDITINDGQISVTSSDDGINGAGGTDGSGGGGGWPPQPPPQGGDYYLYINGGHIAVYADGDGIDVNGDIEMTGGTVVVHGPTSNGNGALDYDGTFTITGGFIVATGSSGMAQAPSTSSTQRSIKVTYNYTKSAGTMLHVQNSSGTTDICTFRPAKAYRSAVISSPYFQTGTSYYLYTGGSSTGTETDGLYEGGTYSPGTRTNTFTTYSTVTNISAS